MHGNSGLLSLFDDLFGVFGVGGFRPSTVFLKFGAKTCFGHGGLVDFAIKGNHVLFEFCPIEGRVAKIEVCLPVIVNPYGRVDVVPVGACQVLADQGSDMGDTERKAISNTIGNSTRQITSLVNKMLALANDSTKDLLSEVDMTDGLEICQKAIADMPDVDPNRIKVSLDDQTGGDKMLYTHGDSLLQMLGNILENSVKFTEEGHIILKVRTEKEKNRKMMFFTVEDTGCGIPSDKVGTIFQRWVKADEFKEGLGLGLAYCWETAQKLGGSLRLVETSEKGTTFELGLPVERVKN